MPSKDTHFCETCGAPFTPRVRKQTDAPNLGRFCSRRCAALSVQRPDPGELFWHKVDRSGGPDACWPFTGHVMPNGYGQVRVRGVAVLAHRFAYTLSVGEIPDGWDVHHDQARGCMMRCCCNPAHLVAMPTFDHKSLHASQHHGPRPRHITHCIHGHPYDEANTGISKSGRRYCRTCNREHALRRYHQRKGHERPSR